MPISGTDPNRYPQPGASSTPTDAQPTSLAASLAKVATDDLQSGGTVDTASDKMSDYLNNALGITQGPSGNDTGLTSDPNSGTPSTSNGDFGDDLLGNDPSRDVSDPTLEAGQRETSDHIDNLYPAGKPQVSDVNQGDLGDCYMLAPLASMASTPAGQNIIQQAIEPVNSTPPSYDVHMYDPDGKPVTISVDGSTVNNGVQGSDGKTNWSAVLEKAWAKYNDKYDINKDNGQSAAEGYAGIGSGGFSSDVYQALTGKPATYSAEFHPDGAAPADPSEVKSNIQKQLQDGDFVTAYSNLGPDNGVQGQDPIATTKDGTDVIGGHAYSVLGVDGDQVILRNPWGDKGSASAGASANPPGTIRMSMDEFIKDFRYTITSG